MCNETELKAQQRMLGIPFAQKCQESFIQVAVNWTAGAFVITAIQTK
jgi:hypothetical protein